MRTTVLADLIAATGLVMALGRTWAHFVCSWRKSFGFHGDITQLRSE